MKNVGYFDNVNGILIGRTFANKIVYDFDYITALKKALLDLNIEVIYDVDIGHVPPTIFNDKWELWCFRFKK